jgi:L-alanine-DL-glutamate epimerase-like enolase superfamily enzyme
VAGWSAREGVLLRLVGSDGVTAQGEASPLPGYSGDNLAATRSALEGVEWARVPDAEPGETIVQYLERLATPLAALTPSARFAAETALLDRVGQRRGAPVWALFDAPGADTAVPLSALIGNADDAAVATRAAEAMARGIRTVKVKIAGPRLGEQCAALARVRAAIGDAALRLDANGSFARESAARELGPLRELSPELVEEPVSPVDLAALGTLPIPLALDESLQDAGALERLAPVLPRLGCVAVVLKPMALGGFSACLRLARAARTLGLDVTVSHLFDGPVALAAAAHLSLVIASRTRASGLDVHAGLAAWPALELALLSPTSVIAGSRPGLGVAPLKEPA